MPSAAKQHSKAGAKAFGRQYVINLGEAAKTLDMSYLEPFRTDECVECDRFAALIEQWDEDDQRESINPYLEPRNEKVLGSDPDVLTYSAELSTPKHELVDREGSTLEVIEESDLQYNAFLVWSDGAWRVDGFTFDER
ncbi:DUF6318 family protein [Marihabitans asiaticum]|uniref:Uncharacterized protein n=1 Tax=Marihabitans asiaticum TaxID=415218 RepID=A0A560W7S0_9MICO|nr:DUF6318 family protein [Marihabitans asiaticum]TWD13672.1 hypothetical protein FB557_2302 [Marihabitans asiaticum]